jgi:hypothetical protein
MPGVLVSYGSRVDCTDVDDRVQSGDSSCLDRNDPRTRVGVARSGNEIWVVVWHNHADQDGAENIEEQNSVSYALCGLWDRSVRVACLGSGNDNLTDQYGRFKGTVTYGLHTDKRETGVDECADEAEEMSGRSSDAGKVGPGSWVAPVSEADSIVVRSTTERDD